MHAAARSHSERASAAPSLRAHLHCSSDMLQFMQLMQRDCILEQQRGAPLLPTQLQLAWQAPYYPCFYFTATCMAAMACARSRSVSTPYFIVVTVDVRDRECLPVSAYTARSVVGSRMQRAEPLEPLRVHADEAVGSGGHERMCGLSWAGSPPRVTQ
jgi:hypothetical protein